MNKAHYETWFETEGRGLLADFEAAQSAAKSERQRVNAYTQPLFDRYAFRDAEGNLITSQAQLYLCRDAAYCHAFYVDCDTAHRANGFTGEAGFCPALRAENTASSAKFALLFAAAEAMGLDTNCIYGSEADTLLSLLQQLAASPPNAKGKDNAS